jgi:hypothetical protein
MPLFTPFLASYLQTSMPILSFLKNSTDFLPDQDVSLCLTFGISYKIAAGKPDQLCSLFTLGAATEIGRGGVQLALLSPDTFLRHMTFVNRQSA